MTLSGSDCLFTCDNSLLFLCLLSVAGSVPRVVFVLPGDGPRPERLMEAEVSALTDEECRYFLYNLDNLYTPEWHICVFSPEGEEAENPVGLCNGGLIH